MRVTGNMKLAAMLIGLALPFCAAHPAAAQEVTLQARQSVAWGPVIVDQDGRSLYVFSLDNASGNAGACAEECLRKWPPLLTEGPPATGPGVEADRVSTITRPEGMQVTYDGWPLYYYLEDQGGDTHGQDKREFGGPWHLIAPDGAVVTQTVPATPSEKENGGIGE